MGNIVTYLEYLEKEWGYSVSIHFSSAQLREIPEDYLEQLLPYNVHRNLYCALVKGLFPGLDDRIVSVISKAGDDILDRMKNNPYGICKEYGIGPALADQLGDYYGVDRLCLERIDYMIFEAIREYEHKGNTRLEYNTFKQNFHDMLTNRMLDDIPDALILPNLPDVSDHKVTGDYRLQYDGNTLYVQLQETYEKEVKVRDELERISGTHNQLFDLEKALKDTYEGIEYCESQKKALRTFNKKNLMIITGGPGTGKTAVCSKIIKLYKKYCKTGAVTLCAPTGKAAKRLTEQSGIEANTIHTTCHIIPYRNGSEAVDDTMIEPGLVIVDEVSMLDLDIAMLLFSKIPGGSILVLCGDHHQLESVGMGAIMRDLIDSDRFPTVVLDTIYRQDGRSGIVFNARNILDNKALSKEFADFCICESKNQAEMLENIKRALNLYDPNDVQILAPFKATELIGVNALNAELEPLLNKMEHVPSVKYHDFTFKVGDSVIFTRNNSEIGYCNGESGKILSITDTIKIATDRIIYDIDKRLLKDVQLSYALTVHKAQGSEKNVVFLVIPDEHIQFISQKVVYTAITRAKDDLWIFAPEGVLERLQRIWRQKTYIEEKRCTGLKQLLQSA